MKLKTRSVYIVELNNKLIDFYQKELAGSIVDFSCGLCRYALNIRNAGFKIDAYDGNPLTPQLTRNFALTIDLS